MSTFSNSNHQLTRRGVLKCLAATGAGVQLGGLGAAYNPAWAEALRGQHRQVLLIWLAGGSSQMETWDPKPGVKTGGPFRAIATNVEGIQISELMPRSAQRTDRLAIVRSLDTRIGDHGGAADLMDTGRPREPQLIYPDWGTVISRELAQADSPVPDYVSLFLATEGHRRPSTGFLGGRYAAMHLNKSLRPDNLDALDDMSDVDLAQREHLRDFLSRRFQRGRDTSSLRGFNQAYARVRGLMGCDKLFDLEQEPQSVRDRYGSTDFGQHALIARRLLEAGVPMVKVARAWWDSHHDNFESHRELVTEFDRVFNTLLDDLQQRGMLHDTLVVVLSEFGRTPEINKDMGRDHFADAWSCAMAGCGIRGGTVHGKTDPLGKTVVDGKVGAGEILATIYQAVGIDPKMEYHVGPRPVPLAPEGAEPISAILSASQA